MSWVEEKYINLCSFKLDKFKRSGSNFNFRCPLCKDSKKNKNKTRGWILSKQGKYRFYCHNCGANLSLNTFFKTIDVNLYYDYLKDKISDSPSLEKQIEEKYNFPKINYILNLKKISQLSINHPAKKYVQHRLIPSSLHWQIYYTPKFKKWVNTLLPNKFDSLAFDEPRLIFPLFDETNTFFGFQGRSFNKKSLNKYITILLDNEKPKLFGLNTINKNKQIFIVEGPIDSLFIDNCLASCGGSLETNYIKDPVIIYDNEPRNPQIVEKIKKAIDNGFKVCIWPDNLIYKDINDMILGGLSKQEIQNLIADNTFYGLEATLRHLEWKKL